MNANKSNIYKNLIAGIFFAIYVVSGEVFAWSFNDLIGPSISDVAVTYKLEGPKSAQSLAFRHIYSKVINKSESYISGINVLCNIYDELGNRIEKDYLLQLPEGRVEGSSSEPAIAPGNYAVWAHRLFIRGSTSKASSINCTLEKVLGEK